MLPHVIYLFIHIYFLLHQFATLTLGLRGWIILLGQVWVMCLNEQITAGRNRGEMSSAPKNIK